MIHEYKRIDLFGKMLFEKVILTPPFRKPHPMEDEACFLYIIEGQYNSISQSDQLKVQAKESVLMKCGNYYSQMNSDENGSRYEAVAVHFFPEVLRKVFAHQLPDFINKPSPTTKPRQQAKLRSDVLVQKYIESIQFYFENEHLVTEEILALKLKEIILLLEQTDQASAIHTILGNLFKPVEFSFRQVIESHLYSPITTEELASLCHMSLSTFKREFKRSYQASPATYIRQQKLKKAASLLSIPNVRISDVAFDCGFSDVANFSKSFKQAYKLSPSLYALSQTNK